VSYILIQLFTSTLVTTTHILKMADEIDLNPKVPSVLPFPPLTKSHILNCSFHSWHPRYKSHTPKARLIPLSRPFIDYLRADGIILPHDTPTVNHEWSDNDSGIYSAAESGADDSDDSDDDESEDPAADWRDLHDLIGQTITSLGGAVVPKLNWSAPKDATWINPTNSLECHSADDVYMLLKSSDFVTHDLEHAFDDCVEDENDPCSKMMLTDIPYRLVLRKNFQLNPSLEFRCFVRRRKIIGICQRDLNHFDFLFKMRNELRERILTFFNEKLRDTFPEENFAFDVYIPQPHKRVWLVDINPWARRTDPLLFSWLELLTMEGYDEESTEEEQSSAVPYNDAGGSGSDDDGDDAESVRLLPELRLVNKDDPEAYGFSTSKFSAHKLPKDVVDASHGGESALRDFAERWKDLVDRSARQQDDDSSGDETTR
jgi:D123 protein